MKQALITIADYTDSSRLRAYLETGMDSGYPLLQHIATTYLLLVVGERAPTPHPVDWPRGINQLGNTCYLNSLRTSTNTTLAFSILRCQQCNISTPLLI